MKELQGKVAVITGGNSGIGLATARKFAAEGARVAICGRDGQTLETVAGDISGDTLAVQADVTKLFDLDRLFRQVSERFGGGIDVLFSSMQAWRGSHHCPRPRNHIMTKSWTRT